jgi:hypothetical protein
MVLLHSDARARNVARTILGGAIASAWLGGCAVKTALVSTVGGGPGEAWIVIDEEKGEKHKYVVHRCTPDGCKLIGELATTDWK